MLNIAPREVQDDPAAKLQVSIASRQSFELLEHVELSPAVEFTGDLPLRPAEVDSERSFFDLRDVLGEQVLAEQPVHAEFQDRVGRPIAVGPTRKKLAHRANSCSALFRVKSNGGSDAMSSGVPAEQHSFDHGTQGVRSESRHVEQSS